jgi:hypothetical protein
MKLHERILTIIGDIKVFKWPCFFIYQTNGYKVRGESITNIIHEIEPGDILLRGYDDYLDGKFIPGIFSHAGFYAGNRYIIHSLAEGVCKEHIFDFCRCDRIALLRIKDITDEDFALASSKAHSFLGTAYDFDFKKNNGKLYCSELVAKIWEHKITLIPQKIKMFGLIHKEIILPDDFMNHPSISIKYSSGRIK